jgi:catechol 2,3-dioxygenase-like lactoylglutathione lyase family enzyme
MSDLPIPARFGHVNLIARDWRRLADFYARVFGCTPVPPVRDYGGPDLAKGTNLPGARLQGVHLRLPGFGDDGPTLEIYQYADLADSLHPEVNRPGFGHIAFEVDDVAAARETVLGSGGSAVGEVVESVTAAGTRVAWCYCRDPEGNVVELQRWHPPAGGAPGEAAPTSGGRGASARR